MSAADGPIGGLLGASPGASVSTQVAVDVLCKCFPGKVDVWAPKFKTMIPSFGEDLNANAGLASKIMSANQKILRI